MDEHPFHVICEVDERNDHSWANEFATEAEALAAMNKGFRDAMRVAQHSVVVYADFLAPGSEEMEGIERVCAYGYRPEQTPTDITFGLDIGLSEMALVTVDESEYRLRRLTDRDDEHALAREEVRRLHAAGRWEVGSDVRVYCGERVIWMWEPEG